MQSDQGKHKTLQILHQVVETAQPLGILRLAHVHQRAGFARRERNVLVVDDDLQLLAADPVGLRPQRVLLLHDLRVDDDAAQLVHHARVAVHLLADHRVVLVVGVVGVAQLAVRPELELEELVAELSLVAHVVAQVELIRIHW